MPPVLAGQPIYRGRFGSAAFQSIYRGQGHSLDLAHQAGIPVAVALLPLALSPALWIRVMGLAAFALIGGLFVFDAARTRPPRSSPRLSLAFRIDVATLFLLQPLARLLGRLATYDETVHGGRTRGWIAARSVNRNRNQVVIQAETSRVELMGQLVRCFRERRLAVLASTGWEEYDCRVLTSTLVAGDVTSSTHIPGAVQVRVTARLRAAPFAGLLLLAAVAATATPVAAIIVLAATAIELIRGTWGAWFVIPSVVVQAVGVTEPGAAVGRRREPANL
jgi:hypothetical protein